MPTIIETVRKEINDGNSPHSELEQFERELVIVATRDSIGSQIESAIVSRKQGRMDDAISQITRANRAQLDAIEGITHTLDRILERSKSEVILAKYRQTLPFEMGIENAPDVIDLVRDFHQDKPSKIDLDLAELHRLEIAQSVETKALEFFKDRFRNGGAEAAIEQAQGKLDSIAEELEDVKSVVVGAVISTVATKLGQYGIEERDSSAIYKISGWLYQIVTSTTLTKPAKNVEVY